MASCHACQRVAILAGSAILMVAILAFEWGSLGAPRESILAGTSLKAAQLEHVKGVSMQVSTISLAEVLELSRYAEAGVCVYTYIYIYMWIRVCVCIYIYIYILHIHTYVFIYLWIYIYIYVYMYMYVYLPLSLYIYIYI